MQDVCPYTCIIEDCSNPDALYVTRSEWMKHVRKDHQQCWECLPCATPGKLPPIFPSVEGFLDHLRHVHGGTIGEGQYSTLLLDAARPAPSGISRCPLCDETAPADSDTLLEHIAEHLHSFALLSLPWPRDESQDEDHESTDYFKSNDYFDDGSEDQSNQNNTGTESDRDEDGLESLPSNASAPRSVLSLISSGDEGEASSPTQNTWESGVHPKGFTKEDCIEYMYNQPLQVSANPLPSTSGMDPISEALGDTLTTNAITRQLLTLYPSGSQAGEASWLPQPRLYMGLAMNEGGIGPNRSGLDEQGGAGPRGYMLNEQGGAGPSGAKEKRGVLSRLFRRRDKS